VENGSNETQNATIMRRMEKSGAKPQAYEASALRAQAREKGHSVRHSRFTRGSGSAYPRIADRFIESVSSRPAKVHPSKLLAGLTVIELKDGESLMEAPMNSERE
jgi:hypothetical protein